MTAVHTKTASGLSCPSCGYNLTAIQSNRCPECGAPVRIARVTEQTPRQSIVADLRFLVAGIVGVGAVVVVFVVQDELPCFAGLAGYAIAMAALVGYFTKPYYVMHQYGSRAEPVADADVPGLPLAVEVAYSPEFMQQFWRRCLLSEYRTQIIAAVLGAALLGALLLITSGYWLVYVGIGVNATGVFVLWRRISGVYYPERDTDITRFRFDEDEFSYSFDHGIITWRWGAIEAVAMYPEMWLLRLEGGGALALPTDGTPSQVFALLRSKWNLQRAAG